MSIFKDNIITAGLSGMLGKQIVFRQWKGATIIAKAPVTNRSLIKSEAYERSKQRFREANEYAKKVMNDPVLKQMYKSKCKVRQNAYNKAVQDFLTTQDIREIK